MSARIGNIGFVGFRVRKKDGKSPGNYLYDPNFWKLRQENHANYLRDD
jgi:hypothetical protein